MKILSPLILINPLIGIPNDFKVIFTGVDLHGNLATTFARVIAGADVLTFGADKGIFGGSKTLRMWAEDK